MIAITSPAACFPMGGERGVGVLVELAGDVAGRARDAPQARFVRGSAMTHTALSRLRRNLAIVIGNADDPAQGAVLDRPGRGVPNAAHSAATPVVREVVEWARSRLRR